MNSTKKVQKYSSICSHKGCTYLKHRGPYCVKHSEKPKPKSGLKTKILEINVSNNKIYKSKNINIEKQSKSLSRFICNSTFENFKKKRVIAITDLQKVVQEPEKVEKELYEKTGGNNNKYMRKLAIILRFGSNLEKMKPEDYVKIRLATVVPKQMSGIKLQWQIKKDTLELEDKYDMIIYPTKHRPQRPQLPINFTSV